MRVKTSKGITVLALTITIIILLILSGITIVGITGENGIIQNAIQAKEEKEISEEKEIVEQATVQTMGNNNRGIIEKDNLQSQLDNITGKGKTIVTEDKEEGGFFVKFIESGRIYKVSQTGEVKYLGIEETLLTQAEIIASPESNLTPELIQHVDLTVKTLIDIGDVDYTLVYAWNKDKENAPEDTKFIEASLTGEGRIKKAGIDSIDTEQGEYYLWIKVVIGEIEKEECFGPYAIKDHTTLISTATENQSESGFLGNEKIQRRNIKSIKIQNSLQGHSINEENCWDVSQSQDGRYLAWYEETVDGKYEVTIAGEGGVVANTDSSYLFSYIGYDVGDEVTITGLENLETGLVTKMNGMFSNSQVKSLILSNFKTNNVKLMGTDGVNASNVGMFQECTKLEELDLSNFDTSNVIGMGGMFRGCSSLKELDLSNFNTSNVISMYAMFSRCTILQDVKLQSFDTGNVIYMNSMFNSCKSLKKLNINNFKTENVKEMQQMFVDCNNLVELDLNNFNTKNVTNMLQMFRNCSSLTKINISSFNTSNVTDMSNMFCGCTKIPELNVKNFDTSKVTKMDYMFYNCDGLTELNVDNFDTSNVTNMTFMFANCDNLKELNLNNFNTSNVTSMASMFRSCRSMTKLNINRFDTSKVTDMGAMFRECKNLSELDISNFNTENVTNMWYMFYECNNLRNLNISNFNTKNVTDCTSMFVKVPNEIKIITNQSTKEWLLKNFPNYTNIVIN